VAGIGDPTTRVSPLHSGPPLHPSPWHPPSRSLRPRKCMQPAGRIFRRSCALQRDTAARRPGERFPRELGAPASCRLARRRDRR
jgi:hypothetical protein